MRNVENYIRLDQLFASDLTSVLGAPSPVEIGPKRTVQQWPNRSTFRLEGFSESVELQRAANEQSTLVGYLSASSSWSKTAYSAIAAKYTHMFSNTDF